MNYLTLLEMAELLAELTDTEAVTAGCIDAELSRTIGVYQREPFSPRVCTGGESSYEISKLRVLIRWGVNPAEAEAKAVETGELFSGFSSMKTSDHIIKFADLKAVRSIGKDEKGVCEYIVDADIIYTERT